MEFIKTGCTDLDNLIEGYPKSGVTLIYGEGGSGKTTLCLMCSILQSSLKGKVLYVDAGNNFSIERLNLMNKNNSNNVLVLPIKNFNVQHENIKNLVEIKNISLIIIDSLTSFYRRLYSREPDIAKAMLGKQLSTLKNISSKEVPVIVTSEVYSDMKGNTKPLAEDIFVRYCNTIIKLDKKPRKLTIKKPSTDYFYFDIDNEGIKKKKVF